MANFAVFYDGDELRAVNVGGATVGQIVELLGGENFYGVEASTDLAAIAEAKAQGFKKRGKAEMAALNRKLADTAAKAKEFFR